MKYKIGDMIKDTALAGTVKVIDVYKSITIDEYIYKIEDESGFTNYCSAEELDDIFL